VAWVFSVVSPSKEGMANAVMVSHDFYVGAADLVAHSDLWRSNKSKNRRVFFSKTKPPCQREAGEGFRRPRKRLSRRPFAIAVRLGAMTMNRTGLQEAAPMGHWINLLLNSAFGRRLFNSSSRPSVAFLVSLWHWAVAALEVGGGVRLDRLTEGTLLPRASRRSRMAAGLSAGAGAVSCSW